MTPDDWKWVLNGVRALTVHNPWAHYITWHGKNIENRTWTPPAGTSRILIHAGAGWDRDLNPARHGVAGTGCTPAARAIVALATVAAVCSASFETATPACDCGAWALVGHHHWRLTEVYALRRPVPYLRGWLGLWTPHPDAVSEVAAQLARIA